MGGLTLAHFLYRQPVPWLQLPLHRKQIYRLTQGAPAIFSESSDFRLTFGQHNPKQEPLMELHGRPPTLKKKEVNQDNVPLQYGGGVDAGNRLGPRG
jgi:hypothetical protein